MWRFTTRTIRRFIVLASLTGGTLSYVNTPNNLTKRNSLTSSQESCESDPNVTNATDVWSIGQIMWQVLSHSTNDHQGPHIERPPFTRLANAGPYHRKELLTGTKYPVLSRYSKVLKNLVRECLVYDTTQRRSLLSLKTKIDTYIADEGLLEDREYPKLNEPDPFGAWSIGNRNRM
jgi:serine/threonine protein kinase